MYFIGEEISNDVSYTSSKLNNLYDHMYRRTFGDFLKDFALEFSKNNTIIIGLNTGFGSGYLKLTQSWIPDLTKLIKFGYYSIFSFTNDYEDMIGETTILEEFFKAKFIYTINDNSFKCMTTYQKENNKEIYSCGNYGIYSIHGSPSKSIFKEISNLSDEQISEAIKKIYIEAKIQIK